jgi:O-antigen/teichoic acid export membrane protein
MWCAYALFSINIIFSVGDAINQGQQKQHINNIFFSVANGINMIMIYSFFLFFGKQSLVIVFILSQIGFILTRVINSLMVLRRIGVTGKIFTLIFFKEFLKNSSSFLFVQLAVLISQQAIVMLCLEKINAQVSGQISLVFRTYAILGSIIAMINQPLWPLLRSAIINGELAWVKRIFFKIYKIYALYGFVIILMLAFFGHVIFGYWVSKVYNFDVKASILVGIQFSLICLSQGNVVVLMGLGAFSQLAKILMLEATLAYISTYAAILIGYNLDLSNILWILIFSNILTSLWILPKNTLRLLNVK